MSPIVNIKIGGGGGLYHYYFGIMSAIQDALNIEDIQFETSSGSGFPVGVCYSNLPMRQCYRLWEARKFSLFRNMPFLSSYKKVFYDMVFAHTYELCRISEREFGKSCYNGTHTIVITNEDTYKKELVTSFQSSEDYTHCLTASSSIPLPLTSSWSITTRGGRMYFDGSLSKIWYKPFILIIVFIFITIIVSCIIDTNKVLLFAYISLTLYYIFNSTYNSGTDSKLLKNNNDLPTIVLETNALRGNAPYGGFIPSIYYMIIGLYKDEDWMYYCGREDCNQILIPKLKAIGVRNRPLSQLLSTRIDPLISTLHTRFDSRLHQFVENQ